VSVFVMKPTINISRTHTSGLLLSDWSKRGHTATQHSIHLIHLDFGLLVSILHGDEILICELAY